MIKCGLHWRDAPKAYGLHKAIYNRIVRWSRLGVFDKIFAELAAKGPLARTLDDRRDAFLGASQRRQPA